MDFKLHVQKGDTDFDTFRTETVKRLRELADQFEKSERKDPIMYMVHNDNEFFEKRQEAKRAKRILSSLVVNQVPYFDKVYLAGGCTFDEGDMRWLIKLLEEKAERKCEDDE